MDTTKDLKVRQDALSWWRSMGAMESVEEVMKWGEITKDPRKNWDPAIITTSTSTIERIYRELVLQENFD